jgi:hypothetical protein
MKNVVVISEIEQTLRDALKGHLGSKSEDVDVLLKKFHNILVKNVTSTPRAVHLSEELKIHPLYRAEKKHIIDTIVGKVEMGEPIKPYLSERSIQSKQHDQALAHFGVHHLHLGEVLQNRGARAGRIKGTKSLLFVRFTEADAFFLDILDHGMRTGFLNMHLFRVMFAYWPESVESFRLRGAVGVSVKYTDDQAADLLENDVNLIVEMAPGKVFMLPGMGTTTAGTPLAVEQRVDGTIDQLGLLVQMIEENASAVSRCIKRLTRVGYNIIRLRARVRDGLLDVYDANSDCILSLQGGKLVVLAPDKF